MAKPKNIPAGYRYDPKRDKLFQIPGYTPDEPAKAELSEELQELFKLNQIDPDRPLIPEDIEFIRQFGRPLGKFELKQLEGVIPFADIVRAESKQVATLDKGISRARRRKNPN